MQGERVGVDTWLRESLSDRCRLTLVIRRLLLAACRATVRVAGGVMTHKAVSRAQETVWKVAGTSESGRFGREAVASGHGPGHMIAEIAGPSP